MRKIVFALVASLAAGPVFAAGNHAGGHGDDHKGGMAVGEPGTLAKVDRVIPITMKETADGNMIFQPAKISVRQGETIRFVVQNKGDLEHEFVLDDPAKVQEHKALMEKFPEMEHDDPNAIRLAPGKRGEVIWRFSNAGSFEFACLIPGHYEMGMKGPVNVSKQ